MQNLRLFDCKNRTEITASYEIMDNSVMDMIKKQTELFFNVKPIGEDFTIGSGETIDMVALDTTYTPVIMLFQKSEHENLIAKGVFYLDWLIEHKAAFNEWVLKMTPEAPLDTINWTAPRLLCIADDFSKYDKHIVSQINRNIELISYIKYGNDLLLFDGIRDPMKSNTIEGANKPSDQVNVSVEGTAQNEIRQRYKPISTVFRIGYCNIENNKHYAVFPNKEIGEITDIPAAIYLAQGQFVLVDEYSRFKYSYPYKISDNELNQPVSSFAVVSVKDTGIFIEKGDNVFYKLNNVPVSIQLRDKNIVSVDSQNNFIRFYKPVRHNADSFMPSAKAKGHHMVFVLKTLPDGAVLRDIETGKEFIKSLDIGNITFKDNQVICIYGNNVVSAFNSYKFYTLSSYYDRFEYGTVEIKDGLVFLQKLTGEKVIINDAPACLYSGQVVYVDENNNFCGIEDNGESLEIDTVKRNVTNIHTYRRLNRDNKIEVTKNVLILGNKAYENSYKLSLLKYGYKAEVIEGFEPWARVNSELKETDIVVVITSHVSHDNMWRIKKEVSDIPVIYSEFDGANRILEQVMAQEQEECTSTGM